ncbi:MAG: CinA family protein [Clostridia bacterium]|nr:CinA family protein [Clostridia bacterium]
MKNVCLIVSNKIGTFGDTDRGALSVFENGGYECAEIRLLRAIDGERLAASVADCKRMYDNVILLAYGVPILQLVEAASAGFGQEILSSSPSGAGIADDGEKTLFLLSYTDVSFAESVCLPRLVQKYGHRTGSIVLRCVGVDGERMTAALSKAENMAAGRASIRCSNKYGEDVIRVFYDENTPKMLTDDLLRFFADELSDNLYALDDTPLENQLIELLRLRRKTLSVAESFTGGGIARKIVSVSGASEVYREGLNTYADGSKMQRLGVTEYTLRSQGAVSEQTAYEMAAGLLSQGNCTVSIATTGLAGPKDDGSGLPIGTCYIAVGIDESVYVYRYVLQGDREEITETAIRYALFLACKKLKNM